MSSRSGRGSSIEASRLKVGLRSFGVELAGRPRCGEDAERSGRLGKQAWSGQTHCDSIVLGEESGQDNARRYATGGEDLEIGWILLQSCCATGPGNFWHWSGKHVKSKWSWHMVSEPMKPRGNLLDV